MLIDSLHDTERLKSGDFFLKEESHCRKIGRLVKGVMRGFVLDVDGNEITTHFYCEGDMVIGSYIPNVQTQMSIQALDDCELSVADYATIMAHVNKDREITKVITEAFEQLNKQLQSRLVALLNLNSLEKYELFLSEFPGLINRIPHYHIANFLGITPTQLSRARKDFINKCK
ncbi:Crp/Fnr family transcriptional regulator [uncultured Draconibacterium sp.]|uniref:Crp/Fnr family transcriptional regulator n=1 Tax=uncultured Draconibacterium sp. TaxID=1573823 RepID=UPI0025E8362E|nr:Crp/Fnr family transcriptional regulator [uncultured Draconibacterium sp.]